MKNRRKRTWLLVLLMLCLCGCGRTEKDKGGKDSRTYQIYYTNLAGTRLEAKSYTPQSDRFDGILTELLEKFQNPASAELSSALPMGVEINGYTMGVDDLQVDFNAAYLGISNVQEILLRAGLVKTLVQLPGVMRVMFTVDGQPLTDRDGRQVSAMNEDTFIDSQGNGINSYHYVTLNLYFSNAVGDKVVKEMRNVFYSSNLIMEKVIVEQIIRGPVNARLAPVVDPAAGVRSVKISKGICVIDLDEKFNNAPGSGTAAPETCLYAFVNAICDACEVEGVQFKINGESDVRFRGQVSLDQVFERDADMIEASGTPEPLTEIFLDAAGSETEPADSQEQQETAASVMAEKAETEESGAVRADTANAQADAEAVDAQDEAGAENAGGHIPQEPDSGTAEDGTSGNESGSGADAPDEGTEAPKQETDASAESTEGGASGTQKDTEDNASSSHSNQGSVVGVDPMLVEGKE